MLVSEMRETIAARLSVLRLVVFACAACGLACLLLVFGAAYWTAGVGLLAVLDALAAAVGLWRWWVFTVAIALREDED
jgi:hypothetical protein